MERQRKLVPGLLGAAVVLGVLLAVGRWNAGTGGYLVLRETLDHPLLLGVLVLVLLLAAVGCTIRSISGWVVVGMWAAVAALVAVPFALLADDPREIQNEPAPDGSERRLVVVAGADMIDPLWWVYVDEGAGIRTRRWDVGFFDGDWSDFREARWAGPDQVRLLIGDQVHLIRLAPDGRPERTITEG